MSRVSIDTEKLKEQVDIISNSKIRLEEAFGILQKDNKVLKDMWNTKTSEGVFESFEDFYKSVNNIIENLNKDIEFLNNVVSAGYIDNVAKTNEQIDDKIAL